MKKVLSFLYAPICLLLYPLLKSNNKAVLDILRWQDHFKLNEFSLFSTFCFLFAYYPNYRSVFYYRQSRLLEYSVGLIFRPLSTLWLSRGCSIGGGVIVEHGFSAVITAKRIGENFYFHQNCTVGYNHGGYPEIGDNVTIWPGAVIAGPIKIGNNVQIGANAVVLKDIPDNCVVFGNPCVIRSIK